MGFHVIKTFENAIRQRMAPFVDFPIVKDSTKEEVVVPMVHVGGLWMMK